VRRLVRIARLLLPLLVGGGAAAVRLQAGEAGAGRMLHPLGGALLGSAPARARGARAGGGGGGGAPRAPPPPRGRGGGGP
jgi:hypothetical protein